MAPFTQQDLASALVAELPGLREEIEACKGSLHHELEAFAQFTQAARGRGDLGTYARCLALAERLYVEANAELAGAFRMSFIEHLDFEGSRGAEAWQLMPARLQDVWNQIAAENRRLMSLPQKHGAPQPPGQRDQPMPPRDRDRQAPHHGKERDRGKKRPPRRGRHR